MLNSPNPTPNDMRDLLKKHYCGVPLTEPEREQLIGFLWILKNDQSAPKAERNAAIELLKTMNKRSQ